MCKLLTITGEMTRQQTYDAINATAAFFERSQRDGFGFAAIGDRSRTATGRYLEPERFAAFGAGLPARIAGEYEERGIMPRTTRILMAHGRTSTCAVNLHNVHPFVHKNHALTHNGVLRWNSAGPMPQVAHGSDSEAFFRWAIDNRFEWDLAQRDWAGWGCIMLANIRRGTLTMAKCSATKLFIAKRSAGGWIMATDAKDLTAVAKAARVKLSSRPVPVPKCILTFSAQGEIARDADWPAFAGYSNQYMLAKSTGSAAWDPADDWQLEQETGTWRRKERRHVWDRDPETKTVAKATAGETFPDWEPSTSSVWR